MTKEKYLKFLEKLLSMTKDKKLLWDRYPQNTSLLSALFSSSSCDSSKSFTAEKNRTEFFLTYFNNDKVRFSFKYDPDLDEVEYFQNDPDVIAAVIRLHNYVYNLFPNAESVVDTFIDLF